jgi:hypothetical protein
MISFEFPLIAEDKPGETDLVARLKTLLDIATMLTAAGWPMRLTVSGLAFEAPEGFADELLRLGIHEPFTDTPGRTLAEVCEAVGELHDALREGRLDDEGRARLAALHWVLGQPCEAEGTSA